MTSKASRLDVDLYLVHWNAPIWCEESVDALLQASNVRLRVSVINNGGSIHLEGKARIIDPGANLGFAAAANVGLRLGLASDADYVAIGCHDVRLSSGALEAMISAMRADQGLGVIGPVLNGEGTSESDLPWINGSLMLIRRPVAEHVEFDERWGSYVEDVDFCYRARDLGWRIGRAGDAHAVTKGSIDPRLASYLMHSNTLVFFLRRRLWRQAARRGALLVRDKQWSALLRGLRRAIRFD